MPPGRACSRKAGPVRAWLIAHQQACARALQRLATQSTVTILSVFVIAIAVALPLGFYVMLANVSTAAARLNTDPNVNVYLALTASEQDAKALEAKFKALPNVDTLTFIPREAALAEMKRTANLAELLASLESNPLPHAFTIRPKQSDSAALAALQTAVSTLPQVQSVVMDFAWAEKLKRFATFAERITLLLGVLLAVAVVFVTGNTIRLQILTQKDEIEVSQLIGATRRFIRRPFLYFGGIQGLLAGIVAVAAVWGLVWWAGAEVAALTASYGSDFVLEAPGMSLSILIVMLAGLLGWLGAFLSVWLYLRRVAGR